MTETAEPLEKDNKGRESGKVTVRSKVQVSEKGPPHFSDDLRFEIAIQRPGSSEWEHLTYGALKSRPLNIDDDRWILSEATRKVREVQKQKKSERTLIIKALQDLPKVAGSGCGALKICSTRGKETSYPMSPSSKT